MRLFEEPDFFTGAHPRSLNTGKNLAIDVTPDRTVIHMPHSRPRAGIVGLLWVKSLGLTLTDSIYRFDRDQPHLAPLA